MPDLPHHPTVKNRYGEDVPRIPGCTCTGDQLDLVGCDCGAHQREHMMNTYTVFWAHDWAPLQSVLSLPPDQLPNIPEGWIGLALSARDPDLTPEDAAAQLDAGGWVLVAVCDGVPTGPMIEGPVIEGAAP